MNVSKGFIKYGAVSSILIVVAVFSAMYAAPALAEHTSTAELQPEWSPSNQHVDYTVTICKNSGDTINEVRVYKNYDGSILYTDFGCDDKLGWEKLYISTYPACFYVADESSPYYDPINGDGECQNFTFSARTPVANSTNCNLQWRFETRDVKDEWRYLYDTTSVDEKPPLITKTIGEPKIPCTDGSCDWIITQRTSITIDATDQGEECGTSKLDYCEYRYDIDDDKTMPWTKITVPYTFNFGEDSKHFLEIRCFDNAGNIAEDKEIIKVDTEWPVTVKTYGEPRYPDNINENPRYPHWINSSTWITLNASDGNSSHASGVNSTYYFVMVVGDDRCLDFEENCDPPIYPDGAVGSSWGIYEGPFQIPEESCHYIGYYSEDNIGNSEIHEIKYQCVYVDNTPPVGTKDVGEPKLAGDGVTFNWWVSQNTPMTLTCTDQKPHPAGNAEVCYRILLDGAVQTDWTCVASPKEIKFGEDSNHQLDYYCRDALGNTGPIDTEYFKVDTAAPVITKTMFGSYLGDCPPVNGSCYVDGSGQSGVNVSVEDAAGVCSVGGIICLYDVWWHTDEETCKLNGGKYDSSTQRCLIEQGKFPGEFPDYEEIIFSQDSVHDLHIECRDALGNLKVDNETFLVDSEPPATTKWYEGLQYPSPITGGTPYPHWISNTTAVLLNATDEKAGVDNMFWRVTLMDDAVCESDCAETNGAGEFNDYTGGFIIPESSCHLIEYYSVDVLGNTEGINRQCVFVDTTKPVASASTGEPKVACSPDDPSGCKYWVRDHATNITLSCGKGSGEPHPAPLDKIQWRVAVDGAWGDWSEANANSNVKITFAEDSVHAIEYKCNDTLGNEDETKTKIYRVDSTPPVINRTIGGPALWKDGFWYVNPETPITFTAVDPDPTEKGCAINNVTCEWSVSLDGKILNSSNGFVPAPFDIMFNEDSNHTVSVHCKDALGNDAWYSETFKVDSTPPATMKQYGQPSYPADGYPRWISSQTPIILSAMDEGSCSAGLGETYYRFARVADENCMNATMCQMISPAGGAIEKSYDNYEGNFTIPEDSCHLIQYYSVDLLGNAEIVKNQCVFVDNAGPAPGKTVGEPKIPCTDGSCDWKITMFTPVMLNCTDSEPHPVGTKTLHYRIFLDGELEGNCMHGSLKNGWCFVDYSSPLTIRFPEESNHTLEFYCADRLGNSGALDSEVFKVEGTSFELSLQKKWNLMSVPFVLLNNNISEVFKPVADDVESVWTYDGQSNKWFVYTPDGDDANDDLKTMEPGWGYWLMAKNDTKLLLGGSLFNPIRTPPSRTLVPGWNLIGPYGTDWQSYGSDDYCMYNNGNGIYWDYAYCSMNSLVDTNSGHPRWSSLWTYVNCPGVTQPWRRINACTDVVQRNRVVSGYGYWVEMDVQEIYAPASVCYKQASCQYS